jgi:hypothetical protein
VPSLALVSVALVKLLKDARTRSREALDETTTYRVRYVDEYDRESCRFSPQNLRDARRDGNDDLKLQPDQFLGERSHFVYITVAPPILSLDVLALHLAELAERLRKSLHVLLGSVITSCASEECAYTTNSLCLPRTWRRERKAPHRRNELTPLHHPAITLVVAVSG